MPPVRERVLARLAVLLLAACLTLDSALPLLPGAFRLGAEQSVETGGRPGTRVVVVAVDVTRPSDAVPVTRAVPAPAFRALRGRPAAPRFRPVHHPPRTDAASDAPADH
jgi:hypothetical protein